MQVGFTFRSGILIVNKIIEKVEFIAANIIQNKPFLDSNATYSFLI